MKLSRIWLNACLALSVVLSACGGETPERELAAQRQSDDSSVIRVVMSTNKGDIEIELDTVNAPISVANFLAYVDDGHYNGTVFHRVIAGFMVQGGGFDEALQQKPTSDPIQNEANNGLKNLKYSLAMARTQVVDSATSQFFINVVDNDFLNHQGQANFGYAVFGKVVGGFEVVDAIAATPTGPAGPFRSDVPVETVVINSVTR